jgi:hypothetical protein
MIDYKYPTIASGATPIGSADRAPDEDLLWEDHQWRARKKILSPLSVEVEELKSKIQEVKGWRNLRFQEVEVWTSQRLKKSKIEEVEVWRLNPSLQLELSLGGYWRGYALQVPAD